MRDWNQPSARVLAELSNPSVVGAAIGTSDFRLEDLGFPQQPERRINYRVVHVLVFENLEAFGEIHRARRTSRKIGITRIPMIGAEVKRLGAFHSFGHASLDLLACGGVQLLDRSAH